MRDSRPSDDGTYRFRPLRFESRQLFARAIVRAFAPTQAVDPALSFPDLDAGSRLFDAANVAVHLGWMQAGEDGTFRPTDPITTVEAQQALVDAVGLGELATDAENVHLRDGTAFRVPSGFGAMLIGMHLGLRYDHSDESLDVLPDSPLRRAEVAWSLYRAATIPVWMPDHLARYANIELPNLGPAKQQIVRWGIGYVGYPYVEGGEWDRPTTIDYCCGGTAGGRVRLLGAGVVADARRRCDVEQRSAAALRGVGAPPADVDGHGRARDECRVGRAQAGGPDVLRR